MGEAASPLLRLKHIHEDTMTIKPLQVTFDTNTANLIADPIQYSNLDEPPGTAERIGRALADGHIIGFVSEASVFVECLSFPDKLTYLALAGRQGARPAPDPRRVAIFDELARLGIRLLHASLIAAEKFIEMPWAADDRIPAKERHDRFCSFIRSYARHYPLEEAGKKSLQANPLAQRTKGMPPGQILARPNDWTLALKRDWDESDDKQQKSLRNKLGPLFNEWCDDLIVGSHHAYRNDYLCTLDSGGRGGSGSILHHGNRGNLAKQGVKIVSPAELVPILDARLSK